MLPMQQVGTHRMIPVCCLVHSRPVVESREHQVPFPIQVIKTVGIAQPTGIPALVDLRTVWIKILRVDPGNRIRIVFAHAGPCQKDQKRDSLSHDLFGYFHAGISSKSSSL